jgi:ABC-type transport system substrate-binding protein
LNLALTAAPRTWDPALASDRESWEVLPQIYETLYEYSYLEDPYLLQPLLAADAPEFSDGGHTVLIRLRRDATFPADPAWGVKSRPLVARDVIYSLKRLALPQIQSPGWWILEGRIQGLDSFREKAGKRLGETIQNILAEKVEGLEALDEHTVRLHLTKPYPQLMAVLALPYCSILAPEAVAKYGDAQGRMSSVAVGTGPFHLTHSAPGKYLDLEKRSDFRPTFYPTDANPRFKKDGFLEDAGRPVPFVEVLHFAILPDADRQWQEFHEGHLDALRVPPDRVEKVLGPDHTLEANLLEGGFRLQAETGATFSYLVFQQSDRAVGGANHTALRKAIASAIPLDALIAHFTQGAAQAAVSAVPPGIAGAPAVPQKIPAADLATVKKLIAQEGFPDGKGLAKIRLDMPGADTRDRALGGFLHDVLAQAGIPVQVVYNTYPGYLDKLKAGEFQIAFARWVLDYPDAQNVYQLLYGPNRPPAGSNVSRLNDPDFNHLYEQLWATPIGPKRREIIQSLEARVRELVAWIPLYHLTQYTLLQPWTLNLRNNEILLNRYKYVRIDGPVKRRRTGLAEPGLASH